MTTDPFATLSGMLGGAIAHHEMVTSYVQAGFSRPEAITITSDLLKHQMQTSLFIAAEDKRRAEEGRA